MRAEVTSRRWRHPARAPLSGGVPGWATAGSGELSGSTGWDLPRRWQQGVGDVRWGGCMALYTGRASESGAVDTAGENRDELGPVWMTSGASRGNTCDPQSRSRQNGAVEAGVVTTGPTSVSLCGSYGRSECVWVCAGEQNYSFIHSFRPTNVKPR